MVDVTPLNKLIEVLDPLKPEERLRNINTALTFLGDAPVPVSGKAPPPSGVVHETGAVSQPSSVAERLKKHNISSAQAEHVFQFHDDGTFGLISVPGKNNRQRTLNTYVLFGLGTYLVTGKLDFSDASAREACKAHGCYDQANHSTTLKSKHPAFIAKGEDWSLTIPGIRDEAAALVKEVAAAANKT